MTDHLHECQLSGKRLESDDAIIQHKSGSYGVKANLLRELTEEKRAEIETKLFGGEAVTDDGNNDADSSGHVDGTKSRNRRNLSGSDGS